MRSNTWNTLADTCDGLRSDGEAWSSSEPEIPAFDITPEGHERERQFKSSRILVPLDLSDESDSVTELASGLATTHGAEIFVLLHIMPITPIDMEREAEERTSAAADQLNVLREDQLPARARRLQEWAGLVGAHGRVRTVLESVSCLDKSSRPRRAWTSSSSTCTRRDRFGIGCLAASPNASFDWLRARCSRFAPAGLTSAAGGHRAQMGLTAHQRSRWPLDAGFTWPSSIVYPPLLRSIGATWRQALAGRPSTAE